MKANEVPEKIYFDGESKACKHPVFSSQNIEYIRIDVFVEKAVEFINKANLYLYHCISEECDYVDADKFIKDFRKYMEGE